MIHVLWVLLLMAPVMLLGQENFDPVRLDDGQGVNYFYPRLETDGGNLLCAWSTVLPDTDVGFVKTEGIHVTPQGQLLDRVTFQQVEYGRIYCPGELKLLHGADGSDPFMIYHS
jgi:hypothetical protein